jgi:hypothetical protein
MLALSDEALARLAIGATRVRSSARGRWLQELAPVGQGGWRRLI